MSWPSIAVVVDRDPERMKSRLPVDDVRRCWLERRQLQPESRMSIPIGSPGLTRDRSLPVCVL